MFLVYILYSEKFDKFYVGHTDDLERRLVEHNEICTSSYTVKYRPWKLAAHFTVGPERGLAMKVERFIKMQKSRAFILSIIDQKEIGFIINRF
jgi:putative endonuclease